MIFSVIPKVWKLAFSGFKTKQHSRMHNYLGIPKGLFACLLVSLLLSTCINDDDDGNKLQDCSVSARCEQQNLAIRLRQVETFYFEKISDESTSFLDIAKFDYNPSDQWIGGITSRVSESDFDYVISYDSQGFMSKSIRVYYDDKGNEAELTLEYLYAGAFLDRSESITIIRDKFKNLIKTIDETISYSFQSEQLVDIEFDVDDSQLGPSSFHYTFNYDDSGKLSKINITQQSNGRADFTFKTFTYKNNKVDSSKSFRQLESGVIVEQESADYVYFIDGPIKRKTAIVNSIPEQKIETVYKWEAGNCAFNQTYGDRLYPTPEIENFPCY